MEELGKLGTAHLPTEVVETPFTLAIWSVTDKKDPRVGAVSVELLFGQRDNPADLTPAERAYISFVLEYALVKLNDGEIPIGKHGESSDWEKDYFFAGYPPYALPEKTDK